MLIMKVRISMLTRILKLMRVDYMDDGAREEEVAMQ